jgi:hypothetical protein
MSDIAEAIPSAAIYQKLAAVYKDVTYIQKDRRNSFHNYTYASEAAIKEQLHEAFVKHGLIMLPPEIVDMRDDKKVNEKGKEEIITTLNIRFGIADVESGESISGTVCGRGVDSSDKGPYKALTGALKYFLTSTFLIPTGDDPENESAEKGSRKAQAEVLRNKLIAGGVKAAEAQGAAEQFEQSTTSKKRSAPSRDLGVSEGDIGQPLPMPPPVPQSPVDEMLARMKDKYSALAEFQRMKKELIEIYGDEGELKYYDTLNAHGVQKSDAFKTLGDSKRAARAMQEMLIEVAASAK